MDRFLNPPPEPGGSSLAGRYRVLRQLGEAGPISTYLAEDRNRFQELCILWEFNPRLADPLVAKTVADRFDQAAGLLYPIHHPQIPRFRELLRQDDHLILVQDYVEGSTYQDLLHQRRSQGSLFSEAEVTQLVLQLLPVLQYLHGLGLVHRAITPDHLIQRRQDGLPVLVSCAGSKPLLIRTDQPQSGLAADRALTEDDIGPGDDLCSLGVTALVLLTGQEPHTFYDRLHPGWPDRLVLAGPLSSVLPRLIAPPSGDRFSSATAALVDLRARMGSWTVAGPQAVASTGSVPTLAVAPRSPLPAPVIPLSPPPPDRVRSGRPAASGCGSALFGLLVLLGVAGGLWWWLDPMAWKTALKPSPPSSAQGSGTPSQGRAELRDRAQALGINPSFLVDLTDALFYQNNPERRGTPLTDRPEDAPYRAQWLGIAQTNLNWLQVNLTGAARAQLGHYSSADFDRWTAQANQRHVGGKALATMADGRLHQFVPDPSQSQDANTPLGQLWLGLAQDSLTQLVKGQSLKELEFAPGSYGQQVEASLAPGQGQVYTLQLRQGQLMRLNLQAPPGSINLSVYVPSPNPTLPYLLANSSENTWAGQVPQSGYYEIVLIGQSQNPVTYRLALAVDNLIDQGATPLPEPTN